jgi:hypothetical protein
LASAGLVAVVVAAGVAAVARIALDWRVDRWLVLKSLLAALVYFMFVGAGIAAVSWAATIRGQGVGAAVIIFVLAWFVLTLSLLIRYAPRRGPLSRRGPGIFTCWFRPWRFFGYWRYWFGCWCPCFSVVVPVDVYVSLFPGSIKSL